MKPPSRSYKSELIQAWLEKLCGYAAACLFPWLATQFTVHSDALRSTPLSLSIAAVVMFTLLLDLSTGVIACVSTAVAFNHFVISPPNEWTLTPRALLHSTAVMAIGILVALLCQRQRVISNQLRLALASLQRQTDALVEAQQGSNSAAWRFSTRDRRIEWAEGGAEVFGVPFAKICTLNTPLSLILPEDRLRFELAFVQSFETGDMLHTEFRVLWPNGELHWLEARAGASPANPEIWRGVMVDITERKMAELALIQSEKLAAIGRLSATVAHEINNPLEAVTNLLFLASLDPHLEPDTRQFLAQADQEVARLATIARHTLTFARPGTASGGISLAEIAENVVVLFQPRCKSRSGQIRLFQEEELQISAPPDEIRQILTNLIANACDALPESEGLIELVLLGRESSVLIEIRDNGSGIPEENRGANLRAIFHNKRGHRNRNRPMDRSPIDRKERRDHLRSRRTSLF